MPSESGDPDWLEATGLPPGVRGGMSLRMGGVSSGPFASLNLRPSGLPGADVDDPVAVAENHRRWARHFGAARPVWLNQVHGPAVVRVDAGAVNGLDGPFMAADASVTSEAGVVCTALVADCLPVLFALADGSAVGAAHAGWRGLAGGVLEATVEALRACGADPEAEVHAWLGACIGPTAFEVGDDVREAFGSGSEAHFRPGCVAGKWWADLPGLARQRLQAVGVERLSGAGLCTVSDPSRFFSFRRDRVTGRHAACVWIA